MLSFVEVVSGLKCPGVGDHCIKVRLKRVCRFCCESKKTFSSRAMLERHIELRHGVDSLNQDGGTVSFCRRSLQN